MLSRARGCVLGHMIGDALGAAVEGFQQCEIRQFAQSVWSTDLIQDHVLAIPMGTFVSAGQPGKYRSAIGVDDNTYVPHGPVTVNTSPALAEQCGRKGMYTDDTNTALALASSIAECGKVHPEHCARRYAQFFRDNEAYRGCPPTVALHAPHN